jgi:hypothetical protein
VKKAFKIFLLICSIFFFASKVFSQGERVEALRAEFIKKKVEMNASESEKFWPVYNEYNDKVRALRRNVRQSFKKAPDNLTEKEAEDLYQLDMKSKQAEADVHKQYGDKIKGIIGIKKLALLRKAEEEFKEILVKSAKEN